MSHRETQIFHYEKQNSGERSRIHLRVDGNGHGVLFVNANRIFYLNQTAAAMARLVLDDVNDRQAIRSICKQFHVSRQQASADYNQFIDQLEALIHPDGACPIHDLDLDVQLPFSAQPEAPYRMDLALTYRCNNDCSHCYNARSRLFPEMTPERWKRVIDRLWEIGIPHIVFTGGEPTLFGELPELIAYAQEKGQLTGLNTNGRRLSDRKYLEELIQAGLDHVQITLESHDSVIHDAMVRANGAWKQTVNGIRNVLDSPLYVMTNTTMLKDNSPSLPETLAFLADLGIPTIGLNALIHAGRGQSIGTGLAESELFPLLQKAREITAQHDQRLIWYTPTEYCHFDPMALELGVKGCTAARYNMCIEPDGSVLPCQSYYQALGNILDDHWESIWNHSLARSIRQRAYIQEKCQDCSLLIECGGGCPLSINPGQEVIH